MTASSVHAGPAIVALLTLLLALGLVPAVTYALRWGHRLAEPRRRHAHAALFGLTAGATVALAGLLALPSLVFAALAPVAVAAALGGWAAAGIAALIAGGVMATMPVAGIPSGLPTLLLPVLLAVGLGGLHHRLTLARHRPQTASQFLLLGLGLAGMAGMAAGAEGADWGWLLPVLPLQTLTLAQFTRREVRRLHRETVLAERTRTLEQAQRELDGYRLALEEKVRDRTRDLRESEERYRSLIELSPDAIVVHSGGSVTFANQAAARLLKWKDAAALTGQPVLTFVPEALRDAVMQRIRQALSGGSLEYVQEKLLCRDGSLIDVEIGGTPVTFRGARAIQLVIRDITERRRHAEELERSNNDLQQFAYVASHDLQEPMRTIASHLHLLDQRHGALLPPDAREFLGFAIDAARRQSRMIQDLLAYSRLNTQARPPTAVAAGECLDLASRQVQARINATQAVVISDPLPTVLADAGQVVSLFQNLLGNALKYHHPQRPPVITVSARPDGAFARFEVRDNGIGFDPAHAKRIFEIFQRLHAEDRRDGTGIGLAVCKRIVERHGGSIGADGRPDQGCTIWFTLPLAPTQGEGGV